jgi:hypothetical protein
MNETASQKLWNCLPILNDGNQRIEERDVRGPVGGMVEFEAKCTEPL